MTELLRQIGGTYFGEKTKELQAIEADKAKFATARQKEAAEDDIVLEYKHDPIFSPENQIVTYTDRLIFIGMTFMFRAITLVMVNAAIQARFITTFNQAFGYYFLLYSTIFIIWVLLVNIRKNNLFVGMLFYYINANYDALVWKRIGIHLLVQLLILPMPILIVDRSKHTDISQVDTYEKRDRMYSTLTFFTLVIWAITSIIALRA